MKNADFLTGITTSGTPHLGNYVGAIRPAVESSKNSDLTSYYFLADYHSLIKNHDPKKRKVSTLEIAAAWIALGLDYNNCIFYRQSDIPEIPELTWILTCLTAKGLMNRAHAYKAAVQENEEQERKDPDQGVTMGLFSYPILMAADILMFNAAKVPVGKDQIQHLEMTRDIAARFNHTYKELFVLPEVVVDETAAVLSGLDGRKMSKSYNNFIPLFDTEKRLRKMIMKIQTNSLGPYEPKDPNTCTLFSIYRAFATEQQTKDLAQRYREGIAWGTMKQELFEYINDILKEPRQQYEELMANPKDIEDILKKGALRAREYSVPFLDKVRKSVGIQSLS
ncbi:tryptophan--tRNA ligase [Desulfobacter hydrogenophilus]|uniref:Tryptophan--tRNA ligase n=1 Tax=Desulfobacter hydrogenophilus TaxID=2291 RepID=A0A328FAG0_9BACT|nr:tryptophan--tRNA ligase [Desulfobacter hydrogenophilus]NDY73325.1 tryptophan--tRNA ligase [Desulfobacter hydrogenophilus]QBH14069.1 tryptophan--tRNA ligase [Desulfobacter hydrogenophilus]RAM01631.1 tryptophan--tRNA ligase [Desulfobacter hydrogenophilus]